MAGPAGCAAGPGSWSRRRVRTRGGKGLHLQRLETPDARAERYWQLLGIINGWPPFQPHVPAFEWMMPPPPASMSTVKKGRRTSAAL